MAPTTNFAIAHEYAKARSLRRISSNGWSRSEIVLKKTEEDESSEERDEVELLMKKSSSGMQRPGVCANCRTSKTPLWRSGPTGPKVMDPPTHKSYALKSLSSTSKPDDRGNGPVLHDLQDLSCYSCDRSDCESSCFENHKIISKDDYWITDTHKADIEKFSPLNVTIRQGNIIVNCDASRENGGVMFGVVVRSSEMEFKSYQVYKRDPRSQLIFMNTLTMLRKRMHCILEYKLG